jgi:MtN3 and saliva related transmembrane protein
MRETIDILITIVWFIWVGSSIPQIYKIWKRKSVADLSISMLWIGFWASLASLAYGIYTAHKPLIAANILGTIEYVILIVQYFKYRK